jgi:molybdate transport system regulatory protein
MPREKTKILELGGDLEISRRGRKFLGGSRIDLLEAIGRRGSISQGAKDVDLSYKAAWDAVDAMNNLAEQPLLIRAIGGQHGGGSYLTAHGCNPAITGCSRRCRPRFMMSTSLVNC